VRAHGEDTTVTTIFGPEWPDAPMRVLKNRAVARAEQGAAPLKQPIGDQLTGMAKIQKHQTKEILPPKSKSVLKKQK
jgi:hypothetical protein